MTVLQATATFAGTGSLSATPIQRMLVSAALAGAGALSATPIQRMLVSSVFAGTGIFNPTPGVIWQAAASFAATGRTKTTPVTDHFALPGSSEAIVVRDKIKARLAAMPFFATFHFTTNKSVQIQPQSIPFAGVYFIDETLTPDGDPNVGEIRFRSSATIGISIIVQNNDAEAAEHTLDLAYGEIGKLYLDKTLYNWKNVGLPGEVAIQAFTRGNRTHMFGDIGQDNAIPIAELRFNLVCDLGTIDYEPVIDDDFKTMHVTTRFPVGGTEDEIAGIQQVQTEYDIPQN